MKITPLSLSGRACQQQSFKSLFISKQTKEMINSSVRYTDDVITLKSSMKKLEKAADKNDILICSYSRESDDSKGRIIQMFVDYFTPQNQLKNCDFSLVSDKNGNFPISMLCYVLDKITEKVEK